jgi:PAS domain S-box-containing protein
MPSSSQAAAPSDAALASSFWQATLDSLPDAVAVVNQFGDIVAVNQAWLDFGAQNGGTGSSLGANYLHVCDAADDDAAGSVAEALREVLAGTRERFSLVYPCHAPGHERWFEARIRPFRGGASPRAVILHQEVTERLTAERRTRQQAELLDAVDAAVIALDLEGNVTYWNRGAEDLYGWPAGEVLGGPVRELTLPPIERNSAQDRVNQVLRNGQWEGQVEVQDRLGRRFPVYSRIRLLRDEDGAPIGLLGVSVDVTARVAMERRLEAARNFLQTITDTMPDGLYVVDAEGRLLFANRAAETLLGWEGEELLGRRMHEVAHYLRPDGSPLSIEECPITHARQTGETVRVEDDVFVRKDGSVIPVSYASAAFTTEEGEECFVVVFNDISERKERETQMRRELDELSWVGRINDALKEDRFELYAQPIVDLQTGETVQHELLLRMIRTSGEVVAPGVFLPVAERHGQIVAIDRWVLDHALPIAARGHGVEINVSAASLGDPTTLTYVRDRLEAHDVRPELVVFEITETALIGNETIARGFVEGVRRLGCSVALDDFGTGYGSFRYLKHIPVSVLKIDREFVADLDGPGRDTNRHVIAAVVSLAKAMGQRTVAEGVETESQREALRDLGIDYVQGYLLGRPAPASEVLP